MPDPLAHFVSGQSFAPSAETFNAFVDAAKFARSQQENTEVQHWEQEGAKEFWIKLTSSLTAGSLESPTTFTFDAWEADETSGSSPKPFVRTSLSELQGAVGVNRDPNMRGGVAGNVGRVKWLPPGEYVLTWSSWCPS